MAQSLARDLCTLVFGVPVLFELVVGLLVVSVIRARNQRTIGRVLAEERPRRALRLIAGSALQLAAFAAILLAEADTRVIAFAGLFFLPALALVWFGTGFEDAVLGSSGVQRGWHSRSFAELGEWRIEDELLKFRVQGAWTSVPCPRERQPELRSSLPAR